MCGLKLKCWVTHKSVCTIIMLREIMTERERDIKILNAERGGGGGKGKRMTMKNLLANF